MVMRRPIPHGHFFPRSIYDKHSAQRSVLAIGCCRQLADSIPFMRALVAPPTRLETPLPAQHLRPR
jgi:hypothetical protein